MSSSEAAPLRVLVVDDEPPAREFVREVAREMPGVEVVGEAGDGVGAEKAIRELRPDLVLLDVRMPEVDGFQVVARLDPDETPEIVFVTAYEDYTLQAFEVHALDYVVKPFDPERLKKAIDHARTRVTADRDRGLRDRVAALLRDLRAESGGGEKYALRITVREDEEIRYVAVKEVDWIEADGNYVKLHVGPTVHRVRTSLQGLVERLDPADFLRIHRSAAVNLDRVERVHSWFGGDYLAVLRDGEKLRVSRTYRDRLLELLH